MVGACRRIFDGDGYYECRPSTIKFLVEEWIWGVGEDSRCRVLL
jgi:hypothetical protein